MCKFVLEQLTGKEFIKTKQLINGLEIDGYCKELALAFERNGEQHYSPHRQFHNENKSFPDQVKRDRKKITECKKMGINLIVISYKKSNKKENIEKWIKNKLKKLNIETIKENVNWEEFNFGNSQIEQLRMMIEEKGGKLISNVFLGENEKLIYICEKGHECEVFPSQIRRGSKCLYCCKNKVCEDNCLATLHPDLANQWDYEKNNPLLPTEITPGNKKKVFWNNKECGHKWEATICSRVKNKECPICKNNITKLPLDETDPELLPYWSSKNTISPKELQLYSRTLAHWSCPNCQHEWEEFPRNLITRQSKCPNCLKNNPKRFKWNENNIKTLIELRNKNLTFKEISKQIGCTPISARGKYSSLFKVENINDKKWHKNFELLKKYKSEFGTIDYMGEYEGVDFRKWICNQRRNLKYNILKEEKKKLLLDIGIENPPFPKEWLQSFNLLKEFINENGSDHFPTKYKDFGILGWVSRQKRQYKNNELISEKIKLFEEIGFSLE